MAGQEPTYFAYLLRLWRVDDDEAPVWRASLQRPGGEERHGFASLDELFAYLSGQASVDAVLVAQVPGRETEDERKAGEIQVRND
jgi:hypothetical protein